MPCKKMCGLAITCRHFSDIFRHGSTCSDGCLTEARDGRPNEAETPRRKTMASCANLVTINANIHCHKLFPKEEISEQYRGSRCFSRCFPGWFSGGSSDRSAGRAMVWLRDCQRLCLVERVGRLGRLGRLGA